MKKQFINKIQELDNIINTKTGKPKTRAEAEKILKNDELKKIEELYKKLKEEKKRIKKLLK